MTENYKQVPFSVENRASFLERLKIFHEEDRLKIEDAYDIAKESHLLQFREGGERHFEHARAVALILYDECRLKIPDLLAAGLLHDTVEDSIFWGSIDGVSNTVWLNEARTRMDRKFSPLDVADPVIAVTKPKVDGIEILDESEILPAYLRQLSRSGPKGKVLKLADILHNSRTLGYRKPYKQIEVAHKNLGMYLPVLGKGRGHYVTATNWMIAEIEEINRAYLEGKAHLLRPDQNLAGEQI